MVAANNSLEQAVALTTAANTTVQNPETVGTTLKTLSMRIRGVKTELEEAGEDTEGMITNTSKLQAKVEALTNVDGKGGINILTNAGDFKSTYDILLEISKVWDKMGDMDQAALLEIIAGKRAGSVVAGILQNGDILKNAYKDALNADGSAMQELNTYLDSIQGKIDQFNNATQTMWMNFMNSEVVKFWVDVATAIVKVVDNIGLLNVAVGAFAAKTAFNSDSFFQIFDSNKVEQKVQEWVNGFKNVGDSAIGATKSIIQVTTAQIEEGAAATGAAAGNTANAAAQTAVGTTAKVASVGVKLLNAALSMVATIAITTAITALANLIHEAANRMNELTESAIKSADELNDTRDSLSGYKEEANKLRKVLSDNTTTEQEAYDARSKLIDIQNQLIDKFGKEAEGINLVTGAIEDQVLAIDKLAEKEAIDWLSKNNEAYKNAIDIVEKAHDSDQFLLSKRTTTTDPQMDKLGNIIDRTETTTGTLVSAPDEVYNAYIDGLTTIIEDAGGKVHLPKNSLYAWGEQSQETETISASFAGKTAAELDDIFAEMQTFLIRFAYDHPGVDVNDQINQLANLRDQYVDEDYKTAKKLYDEGRMNEAYINYASSYGAMLDAHDEFYDATTDETRLKAIEKYVQNAKAAFEKAGGTIGEDGSWLIDEESTTAHMQTYFKNLAEKFNAQEFELKLKVDDSELKKSIQATINNSGLSELDNNQVKDMIARGLNVEGATDASGQYTQEQISGLIQLQAEANKAGISLESLISILTNMGLIAGRPAEIAKESVEAVGVTYSALVAAAEECASAYEILNDGIYDNVEISEDQYNSLKDLIGSEEEFANCIDATNGYVITNTKLLRMLVAEKKKAAAADVKLAKSQTQLEYYKLVRDLGEMDNFAEGSEEATAALIDQIGTIKNAIIQYQMLEDSLLGTTSAFEKFAKAQEQDEKNTYGASYVEMAQTMYDALYKTGEVGSAQFWAAVEATVPDGIYKMLTPGRDQLKAISDYLNSNVFSTLTLDDETFSIDYTDIESFVKKAQEEEVFFGTDEKSFGLSADFIYDLEEGENALEAFAANMKMTVPQVYAMLSEMDKYTADGTGLSMLLQLDQSTTGQITYATSLLERLYAERQRLRQQGADNSILSANEAEIAKYEEQINGLKKQATDAVKAYAVIDNALADTSKKVRDVLPSEIWHTELQLTGDETVQDVLQQIKDYKLDLEEPTVLELEIAKQNIKDELDDIVNDIGKEKLEANVKLNKDTGLYEIKDGKLTVDASTLERYVELMNAQTFIDESLTSALSTTEQLLSNINSNVSKIAGEDSASVDDSEENPPSGNQNQDQPASTITESKPEPNQEAAELTLNTSKELSAFMDALTKKRVELSSNNPMTYGQGVSYDRLGYLHKEAKRLQDGVLDGTIFAEDAKAQLSALQTEASRHGVEVPVTFTPEPGKIVSSAEEEEDWNWWETIGQQQEGIEDLGNATQNAASEIDALYQAYASNREALAALEAIEDKTMALSAEEALAFGIQLNEGEVLTVEQLINRIKRSQEELTSSSLWNPDSKEETAQVIYTYTALAEQLTNFNDMMSQTQEIISDGTEVTQAYKDSLADLGLTSGEISACFESNNELVVKNAKLLKNLVKNSDKNVASNIKLAKSQAQLKYYKLYKQIEEYTNGTKGIDAATLSYVNSLYNQMGALEQTIAKYSMLEAQLLGATNAYNKLTDAQNADNEADYGSKAEEMVNVLANAFNTAELGTQAAQVAIAGLIPDEVIDKTKTLDEQMQQIYDYFTTGKVSKLFSIEFDDDGGISSVEMTKENVESFTKELITAGKVFHGTWDEFTLDESIKNLDDFAREIGVTKEVAFAYLTELEKYDINWLGGDHETLLDQLMGDNLEYNIQKTTKELAKLAQEKVSLMEGGITTEEQKRIKEINAEMDTLNGTMGEHRVKAHDAWQEYSEIDNALADTNNLSKKVSEVFSSDLIAQVGLTGDETVEEAYDKLLAYQIKLGEPTELILELASEQAEKELQNFADKLNKDPVEINANVKFNNETGEWEYTGDTTGWTDEDKATLQGYLDTYGDLHDINAALSTSMESVETNAQRTADATERIAAATESMNGIMGGENASANDVGTESSQDTGGKPEFTPNAHDYSDEAGDSGVGNENKVTSKKQKPKFVPLMYKDGATLDAFDYSDTGGSVLAPGVAYQDPATISGGNIETDKVVIETDTPPESTKNEEDWNWMDEIGRYQNTSTLSGDSVQAESVIVETNAPLETTKDKDEEDWNWRDTYGQTHQDLATLGGLNKLASDTSNTIQQLDNIINQTQAKKDSLEADINVINNKLGKKVESQDALGFGDDAYALYLDHFNMSQDSYREELDKLEAEKAAIDAELDIYSQLLEINKLQLADAQKQLDEVNAQLSNAKNEPATTDAPLNTTEDEEEDWSWSATYGHLQNEDGTMKAEQVTIDTDAAPQIPSVETDPFAAPIDMSALGEPKEAAPISTEVELDTEEAETKVDELGVKTKEALTIEEIIINEGLDGLQLDNVFSDQKFQSMLIGSPTISFDTTIFRQVLQEAGYTKEQINSLINKIQEYKNVVVDASDPDPDPLGLNNADTNINSLTKSLHQLGVAYSKIDSVWDSSSRLQINVSDLIETLQARGWTNEAIKAYCQQLSESANIEGAKIEVTGIENIDAKLEAINELSMEEKVTNVKETGAKETKQALHDVDDAAGDVTKTVTTEYVTKYKTVGKSSNSGGSGISGFISGVANTVKGWFSGANGTAHAQGTAHKGGSWGAPKTETALTGELGPELRVRGNRWELLGENGAEFNEVKKGDIIFNHKQTEELLTNGYITGRGKAFAEGTIGGSAYAFARESGILGSSTSKNQTIVTKNVDVVANDSTTVSANKGTSINTYDDKYNQVQKDYGNKGGKKGSGGGGGTKDAEDEFNELFDWIEVRLEEINEDLSLKGAKLENAVGSTKQNAIIDDMLELNKKLYDNLTAGAAEYYSYAEKLLEDVPAEYRKAAKDGKIAIEEFVGEVDEETLNAIQKYREWVQKGADVTQQAEEVLTEISNLAKQAIDNIAQEYENKASIPGIKLEQLEAYNALLETDIGAESENIYKAMISANNKQIEILQSQRNKMQAELNAQVEAGNIKKYSQAWYDAVGEIAAVDTEIINLTADTEDYQDAMNELHWDHFDNLLSRFEAISDEAENLIDILGNEDLVDKDTAEWTDEGITSLGLYAQQMEVAEMQAKKYKEEIQYLNKNWKKLGYTEQEYVEKLEELKSGQYDSIKAYNDTKKAIVDLTKERVESIKDGIQKEIDAYSELIEKKKEELDAEKDLYDFQKGVANQQKEIADIERKLAALSSDNSASARAKRAQLQAELLEAQAALEDTYYDRSVSNQQEALDKELEAFQDEKNTEMEAWDEYIEDTERVVADGLATIQANTEAVYDTLQAMGQEYSLSIADALASPWEEGKSAIQSYSEKFGLSMSATVGELKKIAEEYKKTMAEIEQAGKQAVSTVTQNVSGYQSATYNKPPKKEETTPTPPAQQEQNITIPKKGSKVKVKAGTTHWGEKSSNKKMADWVPGNTYTVSNTYGTGANAQILLSKKDKNKKTVYMGWVNIKDLEGYAKGTTGVKNNQFAWIDELGEELVIRPSNGRMTFMEKGTGVIPADLTSNLMEWGELDPSIMLERNKPVINAPHITNNNMEINMDIAEVVHIDSVSNDTIPDLTKAIEKQLDKYMKNLNGQIRKYAR